MRLVSGSRPYSRDNTIPSRFKKSHSLMLRTLIRHRPLLEPWLPFDIANPTEEHAMPGIWFELAEEEVEPQALEHDRDEKFTALFRRLGDLGLLGITVEEEYGGVGMDATAAVIVNEELDIQILDYASHISPMLNLWSIIWHSMEVKNRRLGFPESMQWRVDRLHGYERTCYGTMS